MGGGSGRGEQRKSEEGSGRAHTGKEKEGTDAYALKTVFNVLGICITYTFEIKCTKKFRG